MRKSLGLSLAITLVVSASCASSRQPRTDRSQKEEDGILVALVQYQMAKAGTDTICVQDRFTPPHDLRHKLFFGSRVKIRRDRRPDLFEYQKDLRRLGKDVRPLRSDPRPIDPLSLVAAGYEVVAASAPRCAPLTVVSMARPIIRGAIGFLAGDWSIPCFNSPYHATAVKSRQTWSIKYFGPYYMMGGSPVCPPSGGGDRLIGLRDREFFLVKRKA